MFSTRILRTSARRITLLSVTAATALAIAAPALPLNRPGPSAPQAGGLVTHDLATGGETPASLVQTLLGAGTVVTNIQYRGAPIAAGTFTGGAGIIGFESGLLLSTGNIASVVGPTNQSPQTETENQMPGDPDLSAIVAETTTDASILEFDVECPSGMSISFDYVFASEEYDCPPIDDVFACFLNDQNIARIPGTNSPITVARVNCGCPYNPPSGPNCGFYRTNDCDTLGLGFPCTHIATEMDGLTVVLTASGLLHPGPNHVKLAIADYVDMQYDSDVFIRAQSLVCTLPAPVFVAPSPCGQVLDAAVGVPFEFEVAAVAANGLPGQSVALAVTGDTAPLTGGVFDPPMPAGPAQPVSTVFHWTPTLADLGLYHLDFTATDQLQHSASCGFYIRVSRPAPVFEAPTPCGQHLEAFAGQSFGFEVRASSTNGDPGEAVTLEVTGNAVVLGGGTFVPPLPAGPSQPVSTQFHWTPTLADVDFPNYYPVEFTATDQVGAHTSCDVYIRVWGSPGVDLCQAGAGAVIACPCSNPPAASPGGCDNSSGTGGARLASTGGPFLDDCTLVFTTTGESPSALSILLQGTFRLSNGAVYGQGVRCVTSGLKRMYVKTASGGSITAPEPGDLSVLERSAQLGDEIRGATWLYRYYAVYYRDPTVLGGCPASATFNTTQTQEIHWRSSP